MREPSVLDPMAGGGSIPFEALRFGIQTHARELNPVASLVLACTLKLPSQYGSTLAEDLVRWGREWAENVRSELASLYVSSLIVPTLRISTARTSLARVPASRCRWFPTGGSGRAPTLLPSVSPRSLSSSDVCTRLCATERSTLIPIAGPSTVGKGDPPGLGDSLSGDYIKAEAQAGRMGYELYAVVSLVSSGRGYRAPLAEDLEEVSPVPKPGWKGCGTTGRPPTSCRQRISMQSRITTVATVFMG